MGLFSKKLTGLEKYAADVANCESMLKDLEKDLEKTRAVEANLLEISKQEMNAKKKLEYMREYNEAKRKRLNLERVEIIKAKSKLTFAQKSLESYKSRG